MSVSADAMAELPAASRRRVPASVLLPLAAFGLLAVGTLSLAIGPTGISLASLPHALGALIFGSDDAQALRDRLVLLDLRLPRTLLGAFVGAALAVGGAILQGLFRNPLADPALVGVSSGAALGAAATIAFGNHYAAPFMQAAGVYAVSVAAFAGGIATTLVLVALAGRSGRLAIGTLLLTGIAMGAIADSLRGFIAFASDDRELRERDPVPPQRRRIRQMRRRDQRELASGLCQTRGERHRQPQLADAGRRIDDFTEVRTRPAAAGQQRVELRVAGRLGAQRRLLRAAPEARIAQQRLQGFGTRAHEPRIRRD